VLDEESSLEVILELVCSDELLLSDEVLELASEDVASELLVEDAGIVEELELEELLFEPPQATRTLLNSSALTIFTFIFISLITYCKSISYHSHIAGSP
jgi:hypothetical protein